MRRVGFGVGGVVVVDIARMIGGIGRGELMGRRWDVEERRRKRVIEPLRMVGWEKCERSYVMHEVRNWFRCRLLEVVEAILDLFKPSSSR